MCIHDMKERRMKHFCCPFKPGLARTALPRTNRLQKNVILFFFKAGDSLTSHHYVPSFEKVGEHIGFVCPSFFQWKFKLIQAMVLKPNILILHEK